MGVFSLAGQDQAWVSLLLRIQLRIFLIVCSHVASLGAWISIACLGLGPFFQQTVRYDQQSAIDTTKIARTTVAYSYDGARDSTKGGLPDGGITISESMAKALGVLKD